MKLPVTEFFNKLRNTNKIFSCTTRRKNDKKVDGEIVARAGELYSSVYRFGVSATIKKAEARLEPGVRQLEDELNGIITAYDVMKRDKNGVRGAFRRINLAGIQTIKAFGKEYVAIQENNEWFIMEKENG